MLASLVLALNNYSCREVRDADGGLDLIHVLAAVAAGAKRVDAEIFGPDYNLDAVVDFGDHEYRGEGRVPTGCLVKRRDPWEPMNSALACQHAVRILTLDLHGGGLNASLFSWA